MKGAEAVLRGTTFIGRNVLIKNRVRKMYRIAQLDEMLRKRRTKKEALLLHKAKLAGIPCPTVFYVNDFSICIERIRGKRPTMNEKEIRIAARMLVRLHNGGIIHGDFTQNNMLVQGKKLYVIDFGLGFFSSKLEDKATDLLVTLKSLPEDKSSLFLRTYLSCIKEREQMKKKLDEIKGRMRYVGSK